VARTNPCQICTEVPAAEFTLSAAAPQVSWFEQLVVNICEGCLLNAAYQRAIQLGELAARDAATAGPGALESIEADEDLEPLGDGPEPAPGPKSRRQTPAASDEEVPAAATAAPD